MKTIFRTLILTAMLCMAAPRALAQGFVVNLSDGSQMLFPINAVSNVSIYGTDQEQISVSASSLTLTADGAKKTVTVTTNVYAYAVSTSESWLTVTTSVNASGEKYISVGAEPNPSTTARTATVTLTAGNAKATVKVTQTGEAYIKPASTSVSFGEASATKTVALTTNSSSVTAISSTSWLTPTVSSDGATLTLKVTANTVSTARTATVTLTAGSATATISVTQAAATFPATKIFTVTGNGKTVTFNMKLVEAGTFQMGSDAADDNDWDKPVHSVTLTKDYYMGETEVTQALWYAVMGQNPTSDGSQWESTYGLGDSNPAYYVSWNDCQTFISKLNALTGVTFRLPTEAEWEFAAKGGNKSQGYTYAGSNKLGDVAWYSGNSSSKTHEVATKAPNELGLYDMSGNVWEWCQDLYGSYSSSAQTDPTGPTSGSLRVLRGGSWDSDAANCRVADRGWTYATYRSGNLGFRLGL